MMRVIVNPAVLPPDALSELKAWLGITSTLNDGVLAGLLATALDICADFTGVTPIACGIEEMLPVDARAEPAWGAQWDWPRLQPRDWRAAEAGWRQLISCPVLSVGSVAGVAVDGTRTMLPTTEYAVRIDAEGVASVRVTAPGCERCVVSLTAGLATSWAALPGPIRQGVIALAGSQFQSSGGQSIAPPASVTALWLPWRRVRLS